jgi:GT2 family glycosyltransferase
MDDLPRHERDRPCRKIPERSIPPLLQNCGLADHGVLCGRAPMISVIIIQYNNAEMTRKAIASFREHVRCEYEILLVDNASTEESAHEFLDEVQDVTCLRNKKNLGFGAANNLAAKSAKGDILLFLNNDTITTSDFVTPFIALSKTLDDLGIAGPRILNEDGSFQLSAGREVSVWQEMKDKFLYALVQRNIWFMRRSAAWRFRRMKDVDWVTGAAMFVRATVFGEFCGFDDSFFMYFEDKDLCARAKSFGYRVVYYPEASVMHVCGGSRNPATASVLDRHYRKSQMNYYWKHLELWEQELLRVYLRISGKHDGK